ncbi:DotU family type VI secretion system protein [Serratia sp. N21D137]|uniref:DotU family type VI secretion system protein n=1 Tax=Serratia sp. N21D137 TaxID=3397495 RepID=UPI0039E069C8
MIQEQQTVISHYVSDSNPLVTAATPLLNAIPQIRKLMSHDDLAGLRQRLIDEIRCFEMRSQQAGLQYEVIVGARYCLCTALDEAAALTPWGSNGVWSGSGLLVTFQSETWGGEKFFQLLAQLSQNPREHINLLELINYCLLLGFEGRYRVMDNGRTQLETIKQRLWQMIRSIRGGYVPQLSVHGEARPVLRKLWCPIVPLWVCIVLACFAAYLFYTILNWRLDDAINPVLAKIYQTSLPEVTIAKSSENLPVVLNLRNFLRPEIVEGVIAVRDEADRSVVILNGDGLFASASTIVHDSYEPVIDRIAQALNNVNVRIIVVGYSDNVPIRSMHFVSNYELSLERARSVQKQLQKYLSNPERVKAEGRGEMNPFVPNTTPENRARNRRVEIIVLASPDNTRAELNRLPQGN